MPPKLGPIIPRFAQASECVIQFTKDGPESLMLLVEFEAIDRTYSVLLNKESTEVLIARLTGSLTIWEEDEP